jgi:HEAT repeat protein
MRYNAAETSWQGNRTFVDFGYVVGSFWKRNWLIGAGRHDAGRSAGADAQGRAVPPPTAEEAQIVITRLLGQWELWTRSSLLGNARLADAAEAPSGQSAAQARERVIHQLVGLGPAALEPLTRLLRPERMTALAVGRAAIAALALGRMGDVRAAPALLAALRDLRPEGAPIRAAAARGLGELKAEGAATLYRQALLNWGGDDWQADVDALGSLPLGTVVEALIQALGDTSAEVRAAAATAFIDLCLADTPPPGTAEAQQADDGLDDEEAASPGVRAAIKPLIAALEDEDAVVRANAAASLGWIGEPGAAKPLLRCLQDEDERCRSAAALALGMLHTAVALRPLASALGDPSPMVRQQAAEALGELAEPVTTELLLDVLSDEEETLEVRAAAARALGNLRVPQAIPALRELLAAPEPALRAAAIEALARLGFGRAYRLLVPFLWHEPDRVVRHCAARAIARLAEARQTRARWRLRLAWRVDRQTRREALLILAQHAKQRS